MIKDLFFPERIGNTFLFSQTRIGLEITRSSLVATKLNVHRTRATILDFYQEPIVKTAEEETDQATINALRRLREKIGGKIAVTLALPNHIAIFKELTVPFTDEDHIRQILPVELEPQIPFSTADIAFDFIVTRQDKVKKQSTIFVGIVQKKDIAATLGLLEKAGIGVERITLDLFAVYGLYSMHAVYALFKGGVALIDIGAQHTSIAYINQGNLAAVRSLSYGLSSMAKNIAEQTQKTPAAIIEQFVRFGVQTVESAQTANAVAAEFGNLGNQIQFAFTTLMSQVTNAQPIKNVILLSRGTLIAGFDQQLEHTLNISTHYFNTSQLLNNTHLYTKTFGTAIPVIHLACLGSIVPWGPSKSVDLLSSYDQTRAERLLTNQLLASIIMIVVLLASMFGYHYWQYNWMHAYTNRAKNTALARLHTELDVSARSLPVAVDEAQQKIDEAVSIWEVFSAQQHGVFLKYLSELSNKIDRDGLGLNLQNVTMTKKAITLRGAVRDYKALKSLEEALRSSTILSLVTSPQEPKFEIKLAVTPEHKDAA